jgi:hypothetical protein
MASDRRLRRLQDPRWLVLALIAAGPAGAAPAPAKAAAAPKTTAPAPVVSIAVTPANAVLDGAAARRQILVTGARKDGTVVDLTATAKYQSKTPKVVVVAPGGIARPLADGSATVIVSAAGKNATVKLAAKNVAKPYVWSFRNHVQAVLSKAGCNMGACHGAAAGKNGFRLTLRGYDSELDYERLLHEAGARRIAKFDPGNSLLLKKATLAVPHAGGLRFKPTSLEYRVLAQWIASGMPGPTAKDAEITTVEVLPNERTLTENAEQQLAVIARFSDGHTEDVTNWARYSSNEEGIASVDDSGKVTTKGVGETAITVAYLGKVAFARVAVPFPNKVSVAQYKSFPRKSYVDDLVLAQLEKLHILPSDLAPDEEFLRRAYLDAIGTLPTPDEVRAFLADRDPNKRARKIEELLERPEYVDFWTYKWGDLFRVNRETLTEKGMWVMYSWLRDNIAQNTPWDKLVYETLTATGDNFTDGPSNFYRISKTPEELTETVSQAFLGIRVQCAHCHNHPFEKWTQSDYYRFASLFSRIGRKQGDHPSDQVITVAKSGEINFPKTGKPLPPAPYDYQPMPADSQEDRRVYLAKWLTSPTNTYFGRSIVNRVWRHFMGRGLIEPVDDLRATNPASNEPLMDALCKDLVTHNYDLKYLMRQVMNSRTYQLTSRPRPENKKDDRQYSRYYVKRLTAEQLLDAICQVTQQPEKFPGLPSGFRAIQLPDTKVNNYFLDVFGRPPRQITCDCERAQEPNMAQALHLINGQGVNQKISSDSGVVAQLLKTEKSNAQIVEEMYLTCFGRLPTAQEKKDALDTIEEAINPKPVDPNAKPADPKATVPNPKPADPKVKVDPKAKVDPKVKPAAPAVKGKVDPKPAVKPADAKVADPKAVKPADAKPAEGAAKPADPNAKPAEMKPAEPPKIDPKVARRQVFEDLLWALINGKEFVFNH